MKDITVKDILNYLDELNLEYAFSGDETTLVKGFSSLSNYKSGTFTWIKKQTSIPEDFQTDSIILAFVSLDIIDNAKNTIRTKESKRAFFSTIEHFYGGSRDVPPVGKYTYIGPDVVLGNNVKIGHNCTLDGEITIGDNTIIWNNVSIVNRVTIGSNSEIQSGCVIGHDGFGYTEDENHVKKMVKHYGGVTIGNSVLISSNVCVVRGTIDDTVIGDGSKIDNLSHVAHNCILGENVALAFPCFLGGSSKIERNGYIAGGIIRNQCTVHENGFVGMGAVVTKDVSKGTIVIGNPAKEYIRKSKEVE